MKNNILNEETQRHLADAESLYFGWRDAKQHTNLGYVFWRDRNGVKYLYRNNTKTKLDTSLGVFGPATEKLHDAYLNAKLSEKNLWNRLHFYGGLIKAGSGGRNLIPGEAGSVLREMDLAGLTGKELLVVGTHAMAAYANEAGIVWDPELRATLDLDFSAAAYFTVDPLEILKRADSTYTVNTEKTFQARNKNGHEIDFISSHDRKDKREPSAIYIRGQEWLHTERTVDRVVFDQTLRPARIVAPDPRFYAMHKLWISKNKDRNALKTKKDVKQAVAIITAIQEGFFPHYPMDDDFFSSLPSELLTVAVDAKLTLMQGRPNRIHL